VILVEGDRAEPWRSLLADAGYRPHDFGGVVLFRLAGATPATCVTR
jgi:hypothetical protein